MNFVEAREKAMFFEKYNTYNCDECYIKYVISLMFRAAL